MEVLIYGFIGVACLWLLLGLWVRRLIRSSEVPLHPTERAQLREIANKALRRSRRLRAQDEAEA